MPITIHGIICNTPDSLWFQDSGAALFERDADPFFCPPRHAAGHAASVRRHDQGEAHRDSN
jgi:hypothetical protein